MLRTKITQLNPGSAMLQPSSSVLETTTEGAEEIYDGHRGANRKYRAYGVGSRSA